MVSYLDIHVSFFNTEGNVPKPACLSHRRSLRFSNNLNNFVIQFSLYLLTALKVLDQFALTKTCSFKVYSLNPRRGRQYCFEASNKKTKSVRFAIGECF